MEIQAAVPAIPSLHELGGISAGYRHEAKLAVPGAGLALPGAYLKWYDVYAPARPIPDAIRDEARGFLHDQVNAGRLELRNELGFGLLHRCGETFYYLFACTWRNDNELWQTIYFQDVGGFHRFTRTFEHSPAQCVWELGVTGHERLAWSRYLSSDHDEPAKYAYLADHHSGPV